LNAPLLYFAAAERGFDCSSSILPKHAEMHGQRGSLSFFKPRMNAQVPVGV
jgi:hypothetical protein